MSPAGGGRMFESNKLSNGGGKNAQLCIHPQLKPLYVRSTSPASGGKCALRYSINTVAAENYEKDADIFFYFISPYTPTVPVFTFPARL